jgi:SAM-dependent methyltransferase
MDRQYYAEYRTLERTHWWFRARSNILAEQILQLVGGAPRRPRILNVGAALGASSEMLSRFGDVVSVEYDIASCLYVAKEFGTGFVAASITDLPFGGDQFDLVCAFDVIEHVEDDLRSAQELMRVCRPGGVVSVTVPAFMRLWSHHDVVNHHYRRYTLSRLRDLFAQDGDVIFASYYNTLLFLPVAFVRALSRVLPFRARRSGGSGSDFALLRNSPLNMLFYQILHAEKAWLGRGRTFPFGVSALLHWRKPPLLTGNSRARATGW